MTACCRLSGHSWMIRGSLGSDNLGTSIWYVLTSFTCHVNAIPHICRQFSAWEGEMNVEQKSGSNFKLTTEPKVCFTVANISSDPFVYVGGNCGRCMDL
jgi:hypothetical protein